jgi:hypothetical protein
MQTLIIHPEDPTTDFLCPINEGIKKKIVISGGITKKELLKVVTSHKRIMMMGHGSPSGLFAVGQFEEEKFMSYIIDNSFVDALKNKDNVFIWCHANKFVEQHRLTGFYSGMFISEVQEAILYGYDVSAGIIEKSNHAFSKIAAKYIDEPAETIHKQVTAAYGVLAIKNPIAKYNNERLNYFIKNNINIKL